MFLLAISLAHANGKATYEGMCSACHGMEGKGDGVAAASLEPKPPNFQDAAWWEGKTDEHLTKVITQGGASVGLSPLMAPVGAALTDQELAELLDHVKAWGPQPDPEPETEPETETETETETE
ncbi:MAG: cytochrome c [Proteobacteria bacterium]|nr:cytochrome c [Pseudomonadota bacterium]